MITPPCNHAQSPDVPVTSSGVPVRNLWYMLSYAWNELRVKDRWRAEVEDAPSIDALLGSILANLVEQRLRIGLGRDYRTQQAMIRGVRGRVDFGESLKRLAFEHGQACCRFQTYNANVPKNQIVRGTLARLTQVGRFGPDASQAERIRHRLRGLVRQLDTVDMVELKPEFIRRQQLVRQDADYRLMLAICHLLLERQMPTETAGTDLLPTLDREAMTLWRVFETFVAAFFRCHLPQWRVTAQPTFRWHESRSSVYLPVMRPDVLLEHMASGTMVVLDTKFGQSLASGRWGRETFRQAHLYQIYAYLKSQEQISDRHRHAAGVLLYPAVGHALRERVDVQGHAICWRSIDLTQPWDEIERELLRVPADVCDPK